MKNNPIKKICFKAFGINNKHIKIKADPLGEFTKAAFRLMNRIFLTSLTENPLSLTECVQLLQRLVCLLKI